jgi:galactokinase
MPQALEITQVPTARALPWTYALRQRASTLQISAEALAACPTLEALQHLAKRQYRQLAKRLHPDRPRHQRSTAIWHHEFQRVTNAYRWIEHLTALPTTPVPASTPSYPLPWAMERKPWVLDEGWMLWP